MGPFGPGALAFVGVYILIMAALGLLARRLREGSGLADFYLANRGVGALLLIFTLYATQYSGVLVVGVPAEAYRVGFMWILTVGYMLAVVVVSLSFAPKLYRLSRQHEFVTPGDWIDHRFGSRALSLVASVIFLAALTTYLLAQLMAMGHVAEALSGGTMPYWAGVVGLSLVVVLYETLGGMRAVVWTDAIQAIMLLVGITGMLILVLSGPGGMTATSTWIIENVPEKAAVPQGDAIRTWLSTTILIGFSFAIYPQVVQRIFAAKRTKTLRNSMTAMGFVPLVTMLPAVLIGLLAIPLFPDLDGIGADQVVPKLIYMWAEQTFVHYAIAVLILTGTVAAIMSTADSMLLSLSSIVAKDVLAKNWLTGASAERLTRLGKLISWLVIVVLAAFATSPRTSIWGLVELKFEVLIQVAPLFVLGAVWPRFTARAALAGLLVGIALAAALNLAGIGKLWGFHAGVVAFAVNVAICVAMSLAAARRSGARGAP